jgi:hypothetical protein
MCGVSPPVDPSGAGAAKCPTTTILTSAAWLPKTIVLARIGLRPQLSFVGLARRAEATGAGAGVGSAGQPPAAGMPRIERPGPTLPRYSVGCFLAMPTSLKRGRHEGKRGTSLVGAGLGRQEKPLGRACRSATWSWESGQRQHQDAQNDDGGQAEQTGGIEQRSPHGSFPCW